MNVDPELPDHFKLAALEKKIGAGALKHLLRLWGHCASNRRGEFWPGAHSDYVEHAARWDGNPGVLFQALVDCRWVHIEDGGIRIHDWEEQNSFTVQNWSRNPGGRRGKKEPMVKPWSPTGLNQGEPTPDQAQNQGEATPKHDGNHGEPLRVNRVSGMNRVSEGGLAPESKAEIPSEQEFLAAFMTDAIPEDWLRRQWAWWEGNNEWLDRSGRMRNWRLLVRSRWADDRAKWKPAADGSSKSAPETPWNLKARIDALEQEIARHPANIMGSNPAPDPTVEQKEELKKKRAALADLKKKLAA